MSIWVAIYGDAFVRDYATVLAVSPDGTAVYVTGRHSFHYRTVAYEATTGAEWVADYEGLDGSDFSTDIAVSPDGSRVLVTGCSGRKVASYCRRGDYATVAYDAILGTEIWVARYGGKGDDGASSLAVSPDGARVFVTGTSADDYATVAYDAILGTEIWVARYGGKGDDGASSLAVSPDGARVFVTGTSADDYATVAYDASGGTRLWVARYDGTQNGYDSAHSVAVSPDGKRVYVTGDSQGQGFATVAYRAKTGTQVWAAPYRGFEAFSLAASPSGAQVIEAGTVETDPEDTDYATVVYDASTGNRIWTARYDGTGHGADTLSRWPSAPKAHECT